MRIAFLSTMAGVPWGGSEELWYRVALFAKQQGFVVSASIYNWKEPSDKVAELQKAGIKLCFRSRLHYNSITGKAKAKILQKTIAISDLKAILKFNPDLLIVNQGSLVDVETAYFRSFFEELKIPYCNIIHVNTENEVLSANSIETLNFIYSKSSKVYFVSNRNKEVAERMLCTNFNDTEIITNPIGFEDANIVPYPLENEMRFAIVGRIDAKVKGHSILLDILRRDKWSERNWHLNIYGIGPDENYIKDLCSFYELGGKVTFHGHVKDLRSTIWANNHVLLMPSSQEGCPISLVEAMVCGRAAVVSDVGGNAELIKDGVSGFVADAVTPNSFGRAMERMWQSKGALEDMGAIAHQTALAKLEPDPVEAALDKFIGLAPGKGPY